MWRVAEIKFVKLEIHRESRNRRTWQTQGTTIIYLFDLTYKKSIIYAKKFGFVFFLTHPKKKNTFLPKIFFLSLIFADLISPSGATHCAQKSPPKEKPYPNYLYPPHPLTSLSFFFLFVQVATALVCHTNGYHNHIYHQLRRDGHATTKKMAPLYKREKLKKLQQTFNQRMYTPGEVLFAPPPVNPEEVETHLETQARFAIGSNTHATCFFFPSLSPLISLPSLLSTAPSQNNIYKKKWHYASPHKQLRKRDIETTNSPKTTQTTTRTKNTKKKKNFFFRASEIFYGLLL